MFAFGVAASAQTCVGLACQQMTCPGNTTTSVSGVVYAPNGTDPLPNVQVYVPNAAVAGFTPGVSCPVVGAVPSGTPLVGQTTAVDGSFTIPDMPVGTNIPLVIVSGRWRRQLVIPTVTACTNTALPQGFVSFPQNQSQGDIPKIALATGSVDAVECVLRKVGISDFEFTDPNGTNGYVGRVNLYLGDGSSKSGGATIDTATPVETTLMANSSTLNTYDLLMLPCEGGEYQRTSTELANIISFANAGGRVYSTHYSYVWLYENGPFSGTANWDPNQGDPANGYATVNTAFSGGQELAQWLQLVGATTTLGQMAVSTLRQDMNGVFAPTESWLNLNDASAGNPVMQMVFDTPIGSTGNQCGRVLFNEYHVESVTSAYGTTFPKECVAGAMSPQEKLLEYSLFELTNDGGAATLTPTTQAFGTSAVGYNSPVQSFTWTNNSTFSASVTLLTGSQDFNVVGNNCTGVAASGSCTINVVFNPSMLGAETGTLTVGSGGTTLTASLTGNGIPDLTITPATTLTFGSLDVGASATQTLTVSNSASGAVPVPGLVTTGDYSASFSGCGSALPAGKSCSIVVTFTPTASGIRPGTLTTNQTYPGAPSTLTGNGLDFTIVSSPTSGTVIAGLNSSTTVTVTPLAGFAANVKLSCATTASGSTCTVGPTAVVPEAAVNGAVSITTTSQYTVIGYGGFGGGWLWLAGAGTGALLWIGRRRMSRLLRSGLTIVLLALLLGAASAGMTGCSGKLPGKNAVFTAPGTYTYTVTATDGFLVHTATYSLNVTAQ